MSEIASPWSAELPHASGAAHRWRAPPSSADAGAGCTPALIPSRRLPRRWGWRRTGSRPRWSGAWRPPRHGGAASAWPCVGLRQRLCPRLASVGTFWTRSCSVVRAGARAAAPTGGCVLVHQAVSRSFQKLSVSGNQSFSQLPLRVLRALERNFCDYPEVSPGLIAKSTSLEGGKRYALSGASSQRSAV